MKVLIVNKFLYPNGGSESYAFSVGKSLERMGHQVEYFGMYDERNVVGNQIGEYTSNMDFHTSSLSKILYPFNIIYSFEAKRKIGRVLDDFKPDIVHLNNINFQLTTSVIDAVKKRNIPIVQTVHDYQMVCPNHLLYNSAQRGVCQKCVGGSKVNCIKGKCIHNSFLKSVLGTIEAWFCRLSGAYKKIDLFICPSNFMENMLLSGSRIYKGKTEVMHNFVKDADESSDAKPPYNFPYIAFAGRLSEEKGVRVLADTARLLPDVSFVVMGTGPDEQLLCGIENVTLTGFLSGDEFTAILKGARANVVPSVCYENCPMSILEAQKLGVPSVAINMGGMAELVDDGVTGTLAKTPTAESVADAIRRIFDEDSYQTIKENCIRNSKDIKNSDEYTYKLTSIYEKLRR